VNHSKAARILAPTAAAVFVAGLAALVVAHQSPPAPAATGSAAAATRWVDQPAAIPAVAPRNPGIAACTSGDLRIRPARHGLIGVGAYAYLYSATNKSARACYVSGRPTVHLAGKTVAAGPNVLSLTAGVLAPGASATFALTQSPGTSCSAAASRTAASHATTMTPLVKVGTQPGAGTRDGTILASRCSTTKVTPIGLVQVNPKPDALSALTVRLDVPAHASAGRLMKFTVTITNPTGAAIRLAPCPSYEVGISAARATAYHLNCFAPAIRAGQSRTFDMQYTIPAGTRAGLTKIGWFLLNPDRTGTGSTVTITS
jgi:Protein of unknown function (DUF4232)